MKSDAEAGIQQAPSEGPIATQLLAANEQLVVNALRIESRFRAYFDVSPECLYLLRLTAEDQLIFEDVNPAGAALYNLTREQIIGRTAADVDTAEGANSINRNARLALQSGKPLSYEVNRSLGPHPRRILDVIAAAVEKTEDGGLVLICGRDLTAQRQAEEALHQSQKMEAIGQLGLGVHSMSKVPN